ncbi:MAG: hypothetical protein A2651_01760 [Candidatus Yanofskybacteria bacterium RIFCSPHIGHO2_01_FULL_42_12]|uniref:Uncharacterized protein n=1 Tax=Candidatus Yanofskybacteria bacterium RIFCSPLOWO2_01_FULL_42_49 TaxID=1802694 RepID=A0A1F8GCV5_9BACT|nr:MAG: hypothetical protein A2651_01760 [Candidatus Yanofskybacteria bacterium RIFCSPHIGHO2_01_FULL_42_12]OGN22299.1 MAG: hypothetical protein A2918_00040 [Candidatus Yanofskybacteria bacterium RIFCSPLOWO2_01_FULL_42_49]
MPESGVTIEQEIAQLEQQIAEKRLRQLADLGVPLPELPSVETQEPSTEKEALHKIIGEKIQQQAPQYQPAPVKPQQDDSALSYVLPELKDKVQELVNLVFNKSLEDGIKEVAKTNNAALIDAFHDVLVDELYNVLVERKKLEKLT